MGGLREDYTHDVVNLCLIVNVREPKITGGVLTGTATSNGCPAVVAALAIKIDAFSQETLSLGDRADESLRKKFGAIESKIAIRVADKSIDIPILNNDVLTGLVIQQSSLDMNIPDHVRKYPDRYIAQELLDFCKSRHEDIM
jgi:hypothetical protein